MISPDHYTLVDTNDNKIYAKSFRFLKKAAGTGSFVRYTNGSTVRVKDTVLINDRSRKFKSVTIKPGISSAKIKKLSDCACFGTKLILD